MDGIALVLCVIFMFMLIAAYDNAYTRQKKVILRLLAGTVILPAVLFTLSNLLKEKDIDVFYSVDSYSGFSFNQPADIQVTTVTYPKWSCLITETTFKQLPKGK